MEHTHLPWKTGDRHPCRVMANLPAGSMGSELVGYTCLPDDEGSETDREKANAAFIVHACNAHEDLLKACRAMKRANTADLIDEAYRLIEAAIAKAEPKGGES